jgi:hypothetical protein
VYGSQSSFSTRRKSAAGTPSWPANRGSRAAVSASVSYSMNKRIAPAWAVRTDRGGRPFLSW